MKIFYPLIIIVFLILINQKTKAQCPNASFTSTAPACTSTLVDFTNTSGNTGGGWTYFWDFDYPNGGGSSPATSTSQNPTNIDFSGGGSGVYTVAFTITNAGTGCASTILMDIDIRRARADFSPLFSSGCVGTDFEFSNDGTLGSSPTTTVTHSWSFGSGATPSTSSAVNPPVVNYSTSGLKTITHTVTVDYGGCGGIRTDTRTRNVTIFSNPTVSFTSNAPQCISSSVDFTNTGTVGTGYSYSWDFGSGANPANSTAENPTGIVYSSAGTKTITLTISDQNCTSNASQSITINDTPIADFTSTAPKCTGESVDFSNTGTSSGVTYSWNFGSGSSPSTSTSQNPSGIVYSTSGVKTVTLTTTNSTTGCSVISTKTININLTPTVTFTSNAPQCINTSVDFTNTGSTGANMSFLWDFGIDASPQTSNAENPSGIIYAAGGSKTVSLTISNGSCSKTTSQSITINDTPIADFTSTAPKCTGESVDFTNTGTSSGVTYSWDFGSGASPSTSTSQNPSGIVYSTSGVKTVTLTTTHSTTGCSVISTKTININLTPTVTFTSNAPQCANSVVNFTNTGSTGINMSFLWDFGADAIPQTSSSENPTGVVYLTGGTKTITLTIYNGNCALTSTQTISINTSPVADFTSTAPSCTGDSVHFMNTGTVGASYAWSFGNGANPSAASVDTTIFYSSPGIKTVSLITTLGSCVDTMVKTVNITETPAPAFTDNAPKCQGSDVDFNYTGTNGPDWTFDWDFGAGAYPANSSALNPVAVVFNSPGSKLVTLTVTNGMCSETVSNSLTINQTPVADFTSTAPSCTGDSVHFMNTGTIGASYAWSFGNSANPSAASADTTVFYSLPGIKTVSLITTLGSCVDTMVKTVNITETPAPAFTDNAPKCQGSDVDFNYTGTNGPDWTFDWDFGAGAYPANSSALNPVAVVFNSPGSKLVTLTVTNGMCSETVTNSFNIYSLPIVDAGKDTTICADRSVQIGSTSISGYSYSWFPVNTLDNPIISNPIASPIAPVTSYIVNVTENATGCLNIDTIKVTMLSPLEANAGSDGEICRNKSVQIGAALIEGQEYSWSPTNGLSSSDTPSPIATPDSTTTYTLSVSGSGCDIVTDEVTVIVNQLPLIYAGVDDTITKGSDIQLEAVGGVQYTWNPSNSLNNYGIYNPIASPLETTEYIVNGIDIYGCENSDSIIITVIAPSVWVPSAFTPDDNGKNDVFYVRGDGINNFEFRIFDRWGDNIFFSKDINIGWDGKHQISGETLPSGAYVYYIKGVDTNGDVVDVKGLINLIR